MTAATEFMLNKKLHDPNDEEEAIRKLTNYVSRTGQSPNVEEENKQKESAIMKLGETLAERKSVDHLRDLIKTLRPEVQKLGNAKAAKVVRNLIDLFLDIGIDANAPSGSKSPSEIQNLNDIKVELCQECVKWAEDQNRHFLRQALQARLIRLYNDINKPQEALRLATNLVKELKKVDDKDVIVEVQLEESKACYMLNNLTKARSALVSARTTANSIYIPPKMQATLDMQSGILHMADERDFKTAFSYFYEALEGFDTCRQHEWALRALKYMCLCKIMLAMPEEVATVQTSKLALKYASRSDMAAMKAVADAAKKRSLSEFNAAFGQYRQELQQDPVIKAHFRSLSEGMLEKELQRLLEPYECTQIGHIAKMINMNPEKLERKLAQMILDKKIIGRMNQSKGSITLFAELEKDATYAAAVDTIQALNDVVDALQLQMAKLN